MSNFLLNFEIINKSSNYLFQSYAKLVPNFMILIRKFSRVHLGMFDRNSAKRELVPNFSKLKYFYAGSFLLQTASRHKEHAWPRARRFSCLLWGGSRAPECLYCLEVCARERGNRLLRFEGLGGCCAHRIKGWKRLVDRGLRRRMCGTCGSLNFA